MLDLGSLAREAGHPALACNLLEQARAVAREMGECLHECHVALQIGECCLALGEVDEAEAELKAARDIARKFGAPNRSLAPPLRMAPTSLPVLASST